MLYKLLGIAVWKGAKLLVRRRYGPTHTPKPLLAGGLIALGLGILLLVRRSSGDDA